MPLIQIAEPLTEPVTLIDAKLQARVEHDDDDTLLTSLIVAARRQAEHITGRALITQTRELVLDIFPANEIDLMLPDVQSIVSVKFIDADQVEQTLDPADYSLDGDSTPCWLLPAYALDWPSTLDSANAVRVRFQVGFGDSADDVPADLRAWILMRVASLYAQREEFVVGTITAPMPNRFVDGLLDPHRVSRF